MSTVYCNNNCVCIDTDCIYNHLFDIKKRKMSKKLYDTQCFTNKNEPNMEMRKKNCMYGQVCINENCGFRHRLVFSDRIKFSKLIKAKEDIINNTGETSVIPNKKTCEYIVKELSFKNSFLFLEEEQEQEDEKEEIVVIAMPTTTYADILKKEPKKLTFDILPTNYCWADECDD